MPETRLLRGKMRKIIVLSVLVVVIVGLSLGVIQAVSQTDEGKTTAQVSPTATPLPAGVAVQGTQIVNLQGQPVTLLGTNHSSLEYLCQGDGHFSTKDFQLMRTWGMNTVRLPLSSEFWADPSGFCPAYRQTVTEAVSHALAAGMYVILDLQWSAPFDTDEDRQHGGTQCPMPDTGKDVQFWQDIATIYKDNRSVLFDLYGEPFGIDWDTWFSGGTISAGCYEVVNGTSILRDGTYQAIGMSALVAKVRAIAPNNVIVLSGTDWGYDDSGAINGYAVAGTNIVYGTHPFNHADKSPADWDRAFGTPSQQVAVLATEFGSYECDTDYISQAISFFNQHDMSWLAWNWSTGECSGPSLLADWDGTPSAPYGAYIKDQMLAITQQ